MIKMDYKKLLKLSDKVVLFQLLTFTLYFAFIIAKSGVFQNEYLKKFSILFVTIVFEGLPFIIIGSIISSIIHIYISDEIIMKLTPSRKLSGILIAALLGFILPICECAIVSVTKKLLEKKMPIYIAVTLLTAMPIVNPIVIMTTYFAFPERLDIVFIRLVTGFLLSVLIGFIVSIVYKGKTSVQFLRNSNVITKTDICLCKSCNHLHGNPLDGFYKVIDHAGYELYIIGRFFILGSFLATIFRTCIPESSLFIFMNNQILSILLMMSLAYLLSICSESDAFIARKFIGIFPDSAIMSFLILGPMIDIKNTIMLLNLFKLKFTIFLISIISITCFLSALFLDSFVL